MIKYTFFSFIKIIQFRKNRCRLGWYIAGLIMLVALLLGAVIGVILAFELRKYSLFSLSLLFVSLWWNWLIALTTTSTVTTTSATTTTETSKSKYFSNEKYHGESISTEKKGKKDFRCLQIQIFYVWFENPFFFNHLYFIILFDW
jgi:hypothetical protein